MWSTPAQKVNSAESFSIEFTVTFALGFIAGLQVNGVVRRFVPALYEMDGQSIRLTRQTRQ